MSGNDVDEAKQEKLRRESGKQAQVTMAKWKEQQELAEIQRIKRV